jgi:hypothetical protein
MEAGDTFIRADFDKHLWVVLSDPNLDPEHVLIVNLTTLDERKEKVCILKPGEHPWVQHDTCVNYADSVVTTLAKLNAARVGGAVTMHARLSASVLKKMRDAAMESERMPMANADPLIDQGLVECL